MKKLFLNLNSIHRSYAQQEIKFFINIDLSKAMLSIDNNTGLKDEISIKYFDQFKNRYNYLKYFEPNDKFHITLFSGSAFPVKCSNDNCIITKKLHDDQDDLKSIRNEIQQLFRESIQRNFKELKIDTNLYWWTAASDNKDLHKCFLLLKLANTTQNNLFFLQRNFFFNFKNKFASHLVKGGEINNQQYGFYLRSDISEGLISNFNKNEVPIMCLKDTSCYLIAANKYYRTPISIVDNTPINVTPTIYHVTLSGSDKYNTTELKKQLLSTSESQNIELEVLQWNRNNSLHSFDIIFDQTMIIDDTIP